MEDNCNYSQPTYFIVGHDGSYNKLYGDYIDGNLVDFRDQALLEFETRVYNNLKYEKNQDRFGKTLLDRTEKMKDGKDYIKSKAYYVEYEGAWICDTNHLLKWEVANNMLKPNENLQSVLMVVLMV